MAKYGKSLALLAIVALVASAFMLGGCTQKAEEPKTPAAEAPKGIQSVDDLKSGDRVGVQSGTTGEKWAQDNLAPKGVEVVPFDDILAAFAALQAGDVKGVVNDLPISQDIVKDESRGLEVVQEIKTDEAYGFAFNKKSTVLRDSVNWALDEVIKSGEYEEIYTKWFGSKPLSMPESSNTAKPAAAPKTLVSGKLIVGSDTAYPPFENVVDGKAEGFDVELMTAIGEKLGLGVEFKTFKFDGLIAGLQSGTEFDMVASAMTITEDRKKQIDFSDPYINSNQSLAVAKAQ